jgi:hypothetical protein
MFSFLCPGYRGIVQYGRWSFLAIAIIFALLLDALIILNFYWTAILTQGQRNILLGTFFIVWIVLFVVAAFKKKLLESVQKPEDNDKMFREAITLYLRGDWFGTESLILPLIKKNPRDVEMLLLQATLCRHTKRYVEALKTLEQLQLLESAGRWFLEIETERRLIADAQKSESESSE